MVAFPSLKPHCGIKVVFFAFALAVEPAAVVAQQLIACCEAHNNFNCSLVTTSECAELSEMQDRPTYAIGGRCDTAQACCFAEVCVGGDNADDSCNDDAQCPGGTCEAPTCLDLLPCDCLERGGFSTVGTCAEECCRRSFGVQLTQLCSFDSLPELCAAFSGFPTPPNLIPPPNPFPPPQSDPFNPPPPYSVPRDDEAYIQRLARFVVDRQYVNLGWLHDCGWRLTGPLGGLPGASNFLFGGTHPPSRIYYSPGIIEGLCRSRCALNTNTVCSTDADCPSMINVCQGNFCPAQVCIAGSCSVTSHSCSVDDDCLKVSCITDADCQKCLRRGLCVGGGAQPRICDKQSDCFDGELCVTFPPGAMIIKEMHPVMSYVVDDTTLRCSSFPYDTCIEPSDCPGEKCGELLWLKDECYNEQPTGWSVMVRGNDARGIGSDGSHDGWFWGGFDGSRFGNPPIIGSSAVTADDFFGDVQLLIEHDATRYPTGQAGFNLDGKLAKEGSIVPANNRFGAENCLDCHASAISDSTFLDLNNILGRGDRFKEVQVLPNGPVSPSQGTHDLLGSPDLAKHKYPTPLSEKDAEDAMLIQAFLDQFRQFGATGVDPAKAFGSLRFPAATYDHIVTSPVLPIGSGGGALGGSGSQNREMFLTSDQCHGCHDATSLLSLNNKVPEMTVASAEVCNVDQDCIKAGCGPNATCNLQTLRCECSSEQINLSPYAEWSVSPMGMAGRDPIFFAQLESETTNWPAPELKDCIETLCLHCHGVMGQRQLAIDNPSPPGGEICRDLLNPDLFPPIVPSFETTAHFTRDYLNEWPGTDPVKAKYGGLARDGVSCKVCHSVSDEGLTSGPMGRQASPSVFTGNFNVVTDAQTIVGPFEDVKNRPMGRALGIRPLFQKQIIKSALCGSCHTINLPVLDIRGDVALICSDLSSDKMARVNACNGQNQGMDCRDELPGTCQPYFGFEQATYLEWLNSDYRDDGPDPKSCQDCHMPSTFHDEPLGFKIASIQDNTFPNNPRRLPDKDITLTPRGWTCSGGSNSGGPCRSDADCPNGGTCGPPTCLGGSNHGNACTSDADCPPLENVCQDPGSCDPPPNNRCCSLPPNNHCRTDAECPDGHCQLYRRHTLYGLNVFFNEIAQQFPLLLGLRQIDDQNPSARPALFTAREAVLEQARETTATIDVSKPTLQGDKLSADVTVKNLTGHKMPSGVGFRRAFIEFLVLDENKDKSNPIWASGRTNELGVILDGTSDVVLPTEFFDEVLGCPATANGQCYQPHYGSPDHLFISSEDEVQIYEELQQNNEPILGPQFTTSFLERFFEIKDNRLLPKGWICGGKYGFETAPGPGALLDPDFIDGGTCLGTGGDTVKYRITLTPDQATRARYVQATLYFQAIPPYYLQQRFDTQPQPPTPQNQKPDIARLHYIASRLRVSGPMLLDDNKKEFIKDWKLQIGNTAQRQINDIPIDGACCDGVTGICTSEVPESVCLATRQQPTFFPGLRCSDPLVFCEPHRGACCDNQPIVASCDDNVLEADCVGVKKKWFAKTSCSEVDCQTQAIPTVSEWGLVILALLLLVGAKLYFGRREAEATD